MNMRTAFDRMIVLALVAIVAGCAHTVPDDCPVHPKEPAEFPEIRSECFSLSLESIATNRIELTGWLIDGPNIPGRPFWVMRHRTPLLT